MKRLSYLLPLILFSCSAPNKKADNTVKPSDSIEVLNGMGKNVKIHYEILADTLKKISAEALFKYANEASVTAKSKCKFEPTFDPYDLILYTKGDSIVSTLSFRAKNGFGVPGELMLYAIFKNGVMIESFLNK